MQIRRIPSLNPAAFTTPDATRRVGLLLLDTDLTTERDLARLLAGSGLSLHAARIAYGGDTTAATLRALGSRIAIAAALLPPDTPLRAVALACTSAAAVLGEAAVAAAVAPAAPSALVVTPLSAAAQALRVVGARAISILAPYEDGPTRALAEALEARGFTVASVTCLGLRDDRDMARLTPAAIVALGAEAAAGDALFISCTALRASEAVAAIEARTGRPVVTSNQALAWALLRLAGHDAGRLWALPWPAGAA